MPPQFFHANPASGRPRGVRRPAIGVAMLSLVGLVMGIAANRMFDDVLVSIAAALMVTLALFSVLQAVGVDFRD